MTAHTLQGKKLNSYIPFHPTLYFPSFIHVENEMSIIKLVKQAKHTIKH